MLIKVNNITLRPFRNSDSELLAQWRADKEIRFLTMMHPYTVSESLTNRWLDQVMHDTSNKNVYFAIEENDSETFIGYFTLQKIDVVNRNAMAGIVIADKNCRGKGLGKEIMQTGMEYGFNFLGLKKISVQVVEGNTSAIKLYKNLGFETEGTLINQYFFDGIWHNVLLMAKFASDESFAPHKGTKH